jgi:hypothetical protein
MAGSLLKASRNTRRTSAKSSVNRPQPTTPIVITSCTKAAEVLTIVFNQAVTLDGVPAYTTNLAGITAISAALTAPNTIEVTFSATVATATTLTIPYEEPAVRNSSGGFVSTSTFPVS